MFSNAFENLCLAVVSITLLTVWDIKNSVGQGNIFMGLKIISKILSNTNEFFLDIAETFNKIHLRTGKSSSYN